MVAKKVLPDFLLFENICPKFSRGSVVTHLRTGDDYRIVLHPTEDKIRLENNGHPAYGYQALYGTDRTIWFRSVFEFDDGRFVKQEF